MLVPILCFVGMLAISVSIFSWMYYEARLGDKNQAEEEVEAKVFAEEDWIAAGFAKEEIGSNVIYSRPVQQEVVDLTKLITKRGPWGTVGT